MKENEHNFTGCVRAYNALAEACASVTAHLSRELESRFSLSINEFDALLALDEQPDKTLPLSCLLERIRLSQPALSRLTDRLTQRHLVQRRGGSDDRRSVLIHITSEGRHLLNRAIPVHAQCIRETLLERLTLEERSALKAILMKISGPQDHALAAQGLDTR